MHFFEVEKVTCPNKSDFYQNYVTGSQPIILKDLSKNWPARDKWTFDFFKKQYGEMEVPMYDENYHQSGAGYMKPVVHKKFKDYLSIIEHQPTNLRLHNFQIMKRAPELSKDYNKPKIMKGFMDFALLFFGGKNSSLNLHYDIDCSHVFLTHFQTEKTVYLFPPEASNSLYKLPFTNHSHLNVLNPDYEEFPACRDLKGYKAIIKHGETLFIPKLWWHYVHYSEGGYSLALRANEKLSTRARGLYNLIRLFTIDRGLNLLFKEHWRQWKYRKAKARAESSLSTFETAV